MARIYLLAFLLIACSNPDTEIKDMRDEGESSSNIAAESNDDTQIEYGSLDSITVEKTVRFTYQLIDGEHGWGYQIFEGTAMRINQQHIPSMPGLQGFKSSEKARITAEYIIQEMVNGTPLPVLSQKILDSLGVL